MKCPGIKILQDDITRLGLQVHPCCCCVSAWTELLRVANVYPSGVPGKFWLRTLKFKTACLANNTPAPIATYKPFAFKRLVTCLYCHSFLGLVNVDDSEPPLDSYTQDL